MSCLRDATAVRECPFCESEVADLDQNVRRSQQLGGFDVAVEEVGGVGRGEAAGRIRNDTRCRDGGQRADSSNLPRCRRRPAASPRRWPARHLRREDVDLESGWFRIVSRSDARTKTQASWQVPMHPVLQDLLRALPPPSGPWLFCAEPSGKYPHGDHWISTKKLNEAFLGRLQAVGLPAGRDVEGGYTIHSLRHFTETHCVNAGIPQRVVDAWLGHKSDRSMASTYYHLSNAQSQQFMRGLDFAL